MITGLSISVGEEFRTRRMITGFAIEQMISVAKEAAAEITPKTFVATVMLETIDDDFQIESFTTD